MLCTIVYWYTLMFIIPWVPCSIPTFNEEVFDVFLWSYFFRFFFQLTYDIYIYIILDYIVGILAMCCESVVCTQILVVEVLRLRYLNDTWPFSQYDVAIKPLAGLVGLRLFKSAALFISLHIYEGAFKTFSESEILRHAVRCTLFLLHGRFWKNNEEKIT